MGVIEHSDQVTSVSWLWGPRNSITGTRARNVAEVVNTVLSWSDAVWNAIESHFHAEESRLAFRGAWILLQLHAEGRCVAMSENSDDTAGLYVSNSESGTSWLCTLRAIDLALAAASQSRFTNSLLTGHAENKPSTRHCTAHSVSRARSKCRCPLADRKYECGPGSVDGDGKPLLKGLIAHYSGSLLSYSSARVLGASAVYVLTAGMIVTTSLKTFLTPLDTDNSSPRPRARVHSSYARTNVCRKRFGVAWIREVRDLSSVYIQPTKSVLDDAACRLWVFLRLVQSQSHRSRRSTCVPHPCRLREAVRKLYREWTDVCGYNFEPMRRLIGGSSQGLNAVRLLLYSKPGHRYDDGASFDRNFVVALAATCSGVGVADSFEVARAACEEIQRGKLSATCRQGRHSVKE